MYKILDSKSASGEMLLSYEWKEDQAGYNDEIVTQYKLEVSAEGIILLKELNEYISFSPKNGGKYSTQKTYSISTHDLITLIKANSSKCEATQWKVN